MYNEDKLIIAIKESFINNLVLEVTKNFSLYTSIWQLCYRKFGAIITK